VAGVRLQPPVGELVYGRVTKLVPFGSFVQVGDGIEGLVHISEMSAHHVDLPEQVVTPGEELWVKIIDLDLQRRRISLSIKQAAEGGIVSAEYQEHFGEHAYDDEGNYIGGPPRPRRPGPSTTPSTPRRSRPMPPRLPRCEPRWPRLKRPSRSPAEPVAEVPTPSRGRRAAEADDTEAPPKAEPTPPEA
jgi:predicted RNA-binding protein with RPS1 domain